MTEKQVRKFGRRLEKISVQLDALLLDLQYEAPDDGYDEEDEGELDLVTDIEELQDAAETIGNVVVTWKQK
jgi:hypothetical protein